MFATDEKTPLTRPAFSSVGTVRSPKWVVELLALLDWRAAPTAARAWREAWRISMVTESWS